MSKAKSSASNDTFHIRRAGPGDRPSIERIVEAAYADYLAHMDRRPAPMLDDYARRIAAGEAYLGVSDERIVGVVILVDCPDHLLLDNVAVDPAAQGVSAGRRLVGFAEAEAVRRGYGEIRLYTHVAMSANVGWYGSLGWEETHRARQDGYDRIFMRKRLPPAAATGQ